jgi:hypothetical protein
MGYAATAFRASVPHRHRQWSMVTTGAIHFSTFMLAWREKKRYPGATFAYAEEIFDHMIFCYD